MKNIIFIFSILIIFSKTGNVLSDNNIFNVNNIEIIEENKSNKERVINQAFIKGFNQLINRLLLEDDYKKVSNTNLQQIQKLISHYQIINPKDEVSKKNNNFSKMNIFFDKERIHNFFYKKNILYSDIINTEVVLFPLLKVKDQYFIYSQNYFYKNWSSRDTDNLIQYTLPSENIENIEKIKSNIQNIYQLNISDLFKEYELDNIVFANIEISENSAEVFLKTRIEGKKINRNISIKRKQTIEDKKFYNEIIIEVNNLIKDLIKSQNLIDVRTPSFLNVKIDLNNKNNLVVFENRVKNIDLIDNFYVQQLNKDYVLVKIKYLGKINKIMNKLKDQRIDLKMINGQWKISLI